MCEEFNGRTVRSIRSTRFPHQDACLAANENDVVGIGGQSAMKNVERFNGHTWISYTPLQRSYNYDSNLHQSKVIYLETSSVIPASE